MHRLESWLGGFVVRYRWPIIILTLLTVGLAASGMRLLVFSNDSRMFFSKENPQLQALEALEQTYTKVENVLFVVAPKSGNVFEKETLIAIRDLTEASWQIPYSSRIDSITNYQHTWAEGDDLIVENLVYEPESLNPEQIKNIRTIALNEPLLVGRTISPTGHVTGVNVNVIKPGKSSNEPKEIASYCRELAEQIEKKHSGIDIYLTGGVMIDDAFGEAAKDDISLLVPTMYGFLLFIMAFSLRSLVGMFGSFLVILFSTITGMGLAGWFGVMLTPASANAPTIILTLAVADSIHILVTMFHQMRTGTEKHAAISESIRVNFQPVMVTSLTTAIGFLTMNFSDAPPFRALGNIVAMGVTAAFIYSVFFLPALMAVLPVRVKPEKQKSSTTIFEKLAEFVITKKTPIFWSMVLLILATTSGITRIELNDDFLKYFDTRYAFRQASDFSNDNLTGLYIIDWALESGESGGVNNPQYLKKVEEFANWFRDQEHVRHVYTVTDIMKRLNRNMHGDNDTWYQVPDDRSLAAQYWLLYEMSLPFGLDLNDRINLDKSASRMTVTLVDISTRGVRELEARGREWLKSNAPPEMFTYGSGLSIIFSYISLRNIKSMLTASILALTLISLIMILVLRSFKLGLTSLLPNLAPAFMGFGVWGIMVGQVGLAVSVMIAMTMGIVVDDTVHFMSKYRRGRVEHAMSPEDAIRYAFRLVASPIWITTITLMGGFTVLAFSGFQINSHMGAMTGITIGFALLLDFFFLPVLLIKIDS